MKSEEKGIQSPEKQSNRIRDRYALPPEVDIPGASSRIVRQGLAKAFLSLDDKGQLKMLRSTDGPILSQIRDQVAALVESLDLYGNGKGVIHKGPDDVRRVHPKADLESVIDDVLRNSLDESFCFLNEGRLRENIRFLRAHFLPGNEWRKIIYAIKANPNPRILEILSEEGIDGFDCASAGEVEMVLRQNPKADIYFNNPVKPLAHIHEALRRGVRYYTAQGREEIEKILSSARGLVAGETISVSIRLSTPNPEAEINLSDKNGASQESSTEMLQILKGETAVSRGLAIHTGSQNKNPEMFSKGIELMAEVARSAGGVNSLNIGGGIPVNYAPTDHYDAREFLNAINQAIQRNHQGALVPDHLFEPKIILELGRAIIAEAVDLVIPILLSETRDGKKCLHINDGVFTSFSDAMVHHWKYYFGILLKNRQAVSSILEPYRVFGRTCDSGDTLGTLLLPAGLKTGDHLWVKNAGAYLDSQTTYFNGFGPPTYVSYNV